jgi:hypothetical protein
MSRTIEELKQQVTEALSNSGVPSNVIAEMDQVFAQYAPRDSAKRAPARASRGVKRGVSKRGAKRRKK